jgi:MFS family permease
MSTTEYNSGPPGQFVETDVPCQRCGYNLRGLPRCGRCPECGAPVIVALHEDWITLADPEWLRAVALGCKWILGGFAWGLAVCGALSLVAFGFLIVSDTPPWILASLVVVAACAICCIARGLWLFASPHPRLASGDPIETPRRFVRGGIILTVLTLSSSFVATVAGHPIMSMTLWLMGAPFGLGGVVTGWTLGTYTAEVAHRAGENDCARTVRKYRWGHLLSCLLFTAGSVGFLTDPVVPTIILYALGIACVIGFSVLLAASPIYVAGKLAGCATIASDNWNQAERFSQPQPGPTPPTNVPSEADG